MQANDINTKQCGASDSKANQEQPAYKKHTMLRLKQHISPLVKTPPAL